MPRDGSNIYHIPPGTPGIPNTTVASTPYNSYVADVEQDLNLPRPIVAGGTGATDAAGALANLNGEMEGQVVTNYDSMVFMAGSFFSAAGATNPPVAGHAFSGICYLTDTSNMFVEARDQDDTTQPGSRYIRQKKAGVWSAWLGEAASYDARFVNVAGDTMTGLLTLSGDPSTALQAVTKQYSDLRVLKAGDTMTGNLTIATAADPAIILNKSAGAHYNLIQGMVGGSLRWSFSFGTSAAETGGNVGSDYALARYSDAGVFIDTPMIITRSTGVTTFASSPQAPTPAAADNSNNLATTAFVKNALVTTPLRAYLAGLGLSTSGPSTSFTVQPGFAVNSTNTDGMTLAAALTKTTAAWAVGAAGALDTGAVTINTWYHAHLIKRNDTGVVDVLVSLSPTAPTLPANYNSFRRIGAMKTNASSQWNLFVQYGDVFMWLTPVLDVNVTNPGTAAVTRTLTVPTGVRVQARAGVQLGVGSGSFLANCYISALDQADVGPSGIAAITLASGFSQVSLASYVGTEVYVMTDTSARIRTRQDQSDAGGVFRINTEGWIDRRGRDD